jgi:glycosyltransferase involved in cell wall biosynthesis
MNVTATIELRYDRTPDNKIWSSGQFAYEYWTPYLEVFDHIQVIARVRDVPAVPAGWKRADGEGVSFVAIPYYVGPWEYVLKRRSITRTIQGAIDLKAAHVLYAPSPTGSVVESALHRKNYPCGLVVISNPYDVFAPGAVRNPARPFFRWWFPRQLRAQCARACAVLYVTENSLQRDYPPSGYTTAASDVEITDEALLSENRVFQPNKGDFKLVFVGSLAQIYKGLDVLIDAVALCTERGLSLQLAVIGDGKHRAELEQQVARRELQQRIHFLGQLPGPEAVRKELDQADLFVLPSRTEGMPRAVIEAMARGLPCIGSTAGGIPELLAEEDMVPPGDAAALARKIAEVVGDPERMTRMSIRNLSKARGYHHDILHQRKIAFLRYLKDQTAEWISKNG